MLSWNRSKLQPRFTQCQGHADQRKKKLREEPVRFELRISIFLKECKYKTVLYLLSLNIYTKVWTHTNQLLYQKKGSFAHWKCRMRSTWKSYPEPCAHVGISGKTNAEILPKRNKRLPVMRGKRKGTRLRKSLGIILCWVSIVNTGRMLFRCIKTCRSLLLCCCWKIAEKVVLFFSPSGQSLSSELSLSHGSSSLIICPALLQSLSEIPNHMVTAGYGWGWGKIHPFSFLLSCFLFLLFFSFLFSVQPCRHPRCNWSIFIQAADGFGVSEPSSGHSAYTCRCRCRFWSMSQCIRVSVFQKESDHAFQLSGGPGEQAANTETRLAPIPSLSATASPKLLRFLLLP